MQLGSSQSRQRLFDLALAAAVTAIDVGGSIGEAHPKSHGSARQIHAVVSHQPGGAYALVVLAALALIWRRRWPLPVLIVIVALTAAYAGAGFVPGAALVAVYVALYTVATLESRSTAIVAGALAAVVLFVATGAASPFGWLGGTNTVMVTCAIAAVAIGLAVAGRRQVFVAMKERAELAERDREDEARRRVDAERLRIARELHDVVAHTMSMINIQAGVAAHVMGQQPGLAAEALNAIKDASREGLGELRAILNVLRQVDSAEETSPAPRLDQLQALADATTQAGLPTVVSFNGHPPTAMPNGLELAAYRIVQESLTNVLRHAGPGTRSWVTVSFEPRRLVVQVDDDGRSALVGANLYATTSSAADPATRPASGPSPETGMGAGIPGMRERAEVFGGTAEAGPRPGGGWRVRAVLMTTPAADFTAED